jgi:hypothetical protein
MLLSRLLINLGEQMATRVKVGYAIGAALLTAGIALGVIGLARGTCFNDYYCSSHDSEDNGLFSLGVTMFWIGQTTLSAAYGRSKDRPFFPLWLTGLVIGFPFPLLAIAMTTRVSDERGDVVLAPASTLTPSEIAVLRDLVARAPTQAFSTTPAPAPAPETEH